MLGGYSAAMLLTTGLIPLGHPALTVRCAVSSRTWPGRPFPPVTPVSRRRQVFGAFAGAFPSSWIYGAMLAYFEGRQTSEVLNACLNMVVVFGGCVGGNVFNGGLRPPEDFPFFPSIFLPFFVIDSTASQSTVLAVQISNARLSTAPQRVPWVARFCR